MWNICCFIPGDRENELLFCLFVFSLLLFVQGRLRFHLHPLSHWTESCFCLRSSSTGTSACCRSALLEGTVKWGLNIPPCLCTGNLSACELWPLLLPSNLLRSTSLLFYSRLWAGTFGVWTFDIISKSPHLEITFCNHFCLFYFCCFSWWISWDNQFLVCGSTALGTLVSRISWLGCDWR